MLVIHRENQAESVQIFDDEFEAVVNALDGTFRDLCAAVFQFGV